MSIIRVSDNTELFFQDWGQGKPILFVHSWAMNSSMWGPHITFFNQQGMRCIAMDRRGHGRSDVPGGGYHYDRLADDLAELIEHLDLRDLTLVGHSMGCGEIIRYLSRHGSSRIARIVLVSTIMPCYLKKPDNPHGVEIEVVDKLLEDLRKDFPKWLSDNADDFFLPASFGTSPQVTQWTISTVLSTSFNAAIACLRSKIDSDLRGALAEIAVPALLLHGNRDVSEPVEGGRLTAQLIQGSHYKEYAGAPHGLYQTHMAELNKDILRFMATNDV